MESWANKNNTQMPDKHGDFGNLRYNNMLGSEPTEITHPLRYEPSRDKITKPWKECRDLLLNYI